MYTIHRNSDHLVVEFTENFDCPSIESIIRHVTRFAEYEYMNDIWYIGNHDSLLTLDELASMANDFKCMCPRGALRSKTAVVVKVGRTESIIRRWVNELAKKVPFQIKIFYTVDEARSWIGIAKRKGS